jgi:hypothetical protein
MVLSKVMNGKLTQQIAFFSKGHGKLPLCMLYVFFITFALSMNASSTVLVPATEQQLVAEAECIVEGVVSKVAYGFSDATSEKKKNKVPHTFVTFELMKIFKGKVEDKKFLTLRFAGGPYDKSRVLLVSGLPLFDLGDRDILFITGNAVRLCPLVGSSQGRFRIIDGNIFTDDGREVRLTENNILEYGKPRELKEVLTHKMAGISLTAVASDVKYEGSEGQSKQQQDNGNVGYKKFVSFISQLVDKYHDPQELRLLKPVKSADSKQKFSFRITPVRSPGAKLDAECGSKK